MTGGLIDKGKHRAAMGANDINQYLLDLATFREHVPVSWLDFNWLQIH